MTVISKFCQKLCAFFESIPPLYPVYFSALLAVFYTVIAVVADPVFFRDSSEYVALTDAFVLGDLERAFPKHLPVFFTLLSGGVAKFTGMPGVTSLLIVSGFALALTVFPLYGLLKRCVPKRWAAWGTLLFILLPGIVECSIAPLIDSSRFLFVITAFYLIFKEYRTIRFSTLLMLGVVYGCLTLARAEGVLLVGLAIFIHCLRILHRSEYTLRRRFFEVGAAVLLPLIVAGILCAPRMYQMYKLTGYATIDQRQCNAIGSAWKLLKRKKNEEKVAFHAKAIKSTIKESASAAKTISVPKTTAKARVSAKIKDPAKEKTPVKLSVPSKKELPVLSKKELSEINSYENSGGADLITFDLKTLFDQPRFYRNLLESFHLLYLPFTLLGAILYLKRRKKSFNINMLLLTMLLYDLELFVLRAAAGRYLLINAAFVMPMTLIGMRFVQLKARQYLQERTVWFSVPLCILAVGCAVYSMRHISNSEYECFRSLKGYLNEIKSVNADSSRPVVLLIGANRGLGYYSDVNVVWYTKLGLDKTYTLSQIIRYGVAGDYVFYWHSLNVPRHIMIDAVVLDNKNFSNTVKGCEHLFEEPYKEGRLTVYKVKRK